jgi:cytochrome P450
MCRTVTRATTLGDAELEPGDRIVLCWGAANHDPEKFDRPYDVVLDRRPNPHVGFGDGIHRCAGSRFARTEIRIFFEELFARLPNFAVRPGDAVLYPSVGVVTGFSKMPAVADATAE